MTQTEAAMIVMCAHRHDFVAGGTQQYRACGHLDRGQGLPGFGVAHQPAELGKRLAQQMLQIQRTAVPHHITT